MSKARSGTASVPRFTARRLLEPKAMESPLSIKTTVNLFLSLKSRIVVIALVMAGIGNPIHGEDTKTRSAGPFSMKDSLFLKKATRGGMVEASMAESAAKEAKSEQVKALAARIVLDHETASKELITLAESQGLKFPAEKIRNEKVGSADFDQKYVVMVVKDHEKNIAEFEKAAQSSDDSGIKAFAEKTLPILKEHLVLAKEAQAKLKKEPAY